MIPDQMVYYALNENPLHLDLTLHSVKSLRKYNIKVPVEVFIFGKLAKKDKLNLLKLNVSVREMAFPKEVDATYLKWFALPFINAKRILYLDSDTYFFGDVEILFKKYRKKEFYAREELGASKKLGYQQLGNLVIPPIINHRKMQALSKFLNFKIVPFFNSGVMMMSQAFAWKMGAQTEEFSRLRQFFCEKPLLLPSMIPYLAEQVVAAIMVGKIKDFDFGHLDRGDVPFYVEWRGKGVPSPGLLMHYHSYSAPFFFRDIKGEKLARRLRFPAPFTFEYLQP